MNHPIYKVISCKIIAAHTLQLHFEDNTIQTINFQSVLVGEMYGLLVKIELFNQVKIDPEVHTLVWPMERILILRCFMIGSRIFQNCNHASRNGESLHDNISNPNVATNPRRKQASLLMRM